MGERELRVSSRAKGLSGARRKRLGGEAAAAAAEQNCSPAPDCTSVFCPNQTFSLVKTNPCSVTSLETPALPLEDKRCRHHPPGAKRPKLRSKRQLLRPGHRQQTPPGTLPGPDASHRASEETTARSLPSEGSQSSRLERGQDTGQQALVATGRGGGEGSARGRQGCD